MFWRGADTVFLWLVGALVLLGFLIFTSASLGLAREGVELMQRVVVKQFLVGIIGGGIMFAIMSAVHYTFWRKYAFYIFCGVLGLSLLVFVPWLSLEHGGAQRWIRIAGFSFQPSEFLKLGYVIYMATWFSGVRQKMNTWQFGMVPYIAATGSVMLIMFLQRDTGGLIIMLSAALALLLATGIRLRMFFAMCGLGLLGIGAIIVSRPYIIERIITFFNRNTDALGSGWQIKQSLIAIGSGEVFGRGYGQSVQKFGHLPEPTTDSIFAVFAEEWGFVGAVILVALFLALALRGYRIAARARNLFGTLLVTGIVTLIVAQAFVNMSAMLELIPLSGLTLPFVSQGGTSLLATLAALGIVVNVSKFQRKHIQ